MLIECYECKGKVSDSAAACPHCGAVSQEGEKSLPVVVTDLDMRFGSIFWFIIKAAVAAVPAVILLYTATVVFQGVVSPFLNH
jgi:hypothetical protein